MKNNKPGVVAWGNDPRKMSEADLLPCPNCNHQAGKATKRAAKGFPFVGLWKVSCQRPECPLAMNYFHPVEWNQLPRIKQAEYASLQAECEELKRALSESQANDRQTMAYLNEVRAIVGGDDFPDMVRRCEKLQAECEKLHKDAERIEWLEDQTKKSRTGISFDYHRYVEDGYVVDHGYRFMRRHFASGFKDSLRKAIDAAMQEIET